MWGGRRYSEGVPLIMAGEGDDVIADLAALVELSQEDESTLQVVEELSDWIAAELSKARERKVK
jgi:hypothetical protein